MKTSLSVMSIAATISVSNFLGLAFTVPNIQITERGSGRIKIEYTERGSGRVTTDQAYRGSGRMMNEPAVQAYRGSGRLVA